MDSFIWLCVFSVSAVKILMSKNFDELVSVMARLRAPGGCPWDAEQTYERWRSIF
jgi:uncharacterized protein YabN with tetrapyrrole methylase and pyrophosphatase domain